MSAPTTEPAVNPATQAPTVAPTTAPAKKHELTTEKMLWGLAIFVAAVGAINWLLTAQFDFNLVDKLFGVNSDASKIVYTLVGIAGIATLVCLYNCAQRYD